jgi:hypothetical protein
MLVCALTLALLYRLRWNPLLAVLAGAGTGLALTWLPR